MEYHYQLGFCVILGSVLVTGCGYEDQFPEAPIAVLRADKDVVYEGESITLDASGSEYAELQWSMNNSKLTACGSEEICSVVMKTVGAFEISVEASNGVSDVNSVHIQVLSRQDAASSNNTTTNESAQKETRSLLSSTDNFGTKTGKHTYLGMIQDGAGGFEHLRFIESIVSSPDGRYLYAVSSSESAMSVLFRDVNTGGVSLVQTLIDGIDGVDGLNNAHDIVVSPDGKHVYAAGSGNSAISAFSRDLDTGMLTFLETEKDGINGVEGLFWNTSLAISSDGKHLYSLGAFDDAVSVFSRNSDTGLLSFIDYYDEFTGGPDLSRVWAIEVSPDGKSVYASAVVSDSLVVFSRNSDTGELTWRESHINGANGVTGLSHPEHITVSPDNKTVYVASYSDDSIAIFSRNLDTGALTFQTTVDDESNGVTGLDGANSVIVSPDNEHVYVTSFIDNAMSVFDRDLDTGLLTLVDEHKDGVDSVDGLSGASYVLITPDNKHVYASGASDSAISIFSRD